MAEAYRTFDQEVGAAGLIARPVADRPPAGTYMDLKNWEYRQEGAISSRFGREAITVDLVGLVNTPLPDEIHTLARLKSLVGIEAGNPDSSYRYAIDVQGHVHRRKGDSQGAYSAPIEAVPLSGQRDTTEVYRPSNSGVPYLFIADVDPTKNSAADGPGGSMVKDRGDGSLVVLQRWGILPPTRPATSEISALVSTLIDRFNGVTGDYTFTNFSSPAISEFLNALLVADVAAGRQTAVVQYQNWDPGTAYSPGDQVTIVNQNTTPQNVNQSFTCIVGNTGQSPIFTQGYWSPLTDPNDLVASGQLLLVNAADDVIVLQSTGDFPNNQAAGRFFTAQFQSAYPAATTVEDWMLTAIAAANTTANLNRSGSFDFTMIGGEPALDSDQFCLMFHPDANSNILAFRITFYTDPSNFYFCDFGPPGSLASWEHVLVTRDSFVPNGSPDWANITKWEIAFSVGNNGATINIGDFYFTRNAALDSTGGVGYDYRYTFYNINTGNESNPSVAQINSLNVVGQQVAVSWSPEPIDGQVTHVRLYRRGGSLGDNWRMIAQIPILTLPPYYDNIPDSLLNTAKILKLDSDPPVTSALRVPVDTTFTAAIAVGGPTFVPVADISNIWPNQYLLVDVGTRQETVAVEEILNIAGTWNVLATFQLAHVSGARIQASARIARPVNICAEAFDRMWLAGDPDNPHVLYYSDKFNAESFPPQNTVECGTPDDPITAIIKFAGQLYVATQSHWFNIIIYTDGTVAPPFPSSSRHGVRGIAAWTKVEDEIWFLSEDGMYAFSGQSAPYMSEKVEWLFRGIDLGPVDALDLSLFADVCIAYDLHEVFISYTSACDGMTRHRLIYDTHYCLPDRSKALTREGWKDCDELKAGEEIFVYDQESETCKWSPCLAVNRFEYSGELIHWKGGRHGTKFDFEFTPNHNWVWRGETGKGPKWRKQKEVIRPGADIGKFGELRQSARLSGEETRSTLSPREAAILGWIVTDGSITRNNGKGRRSSRVYQSCTSRYIGEIESLLGPDCTSSNVREATGVAAGHTGPYRIFLISTDFTEKLLKKCRYKSKSDLPGIVSGLNYLAAKAMLTAMLHADGHCGRQSWLSQKNTDVIDAFRILGAICGSATSKVRQSGDANISCLLDSQFTDCEHLTRSTEEYCGRVWCPTTKEGTWVSLLNDTISITGNSRWRNDDRQTRAMLYEQDLTDLLFSTYDTMLAMIWKDRINNYDDGGFVDSVRVKVPIELRLQGTNQDENLPKSQKVYNEMTLDVETGAQTLTAFLLSDNSQTATPVGTVTQATRDSVSMPGINEGFGVRSRNQALLLTGSVEDVVTLYKYMLRGTVEAEQRKSYDSYWTDFGQDGWKFFKQAWFNYTALDADGVQVCVHLDGHDEYSTFSFVLPQSTKRSSILVRFPATKFRLVRIIGESAGDFQVFVDSHLDWKPATSDRGYASQSFAELVGATPEQ